MTMSTQNLWFLAKVDDEITRYFQALGYATDWDRDRKGRYYEILTREVSEGGKLVCQIDFGVPLAHLVEDMLHWAKGEESTSDSTYEVRTETADSPLFNALLGRVVEHESRKKGEKRS
jgi:hypothetical protein